MPSIRNIISHLLVLTTMVYLGSCKPISETATILVTDLTTGVDFGCLTASAQVQSIGPPCATFTAVAAKGGDATIQDEPGLSLGFEPGDPSNSTTPEDLLFDISTFISNTWSVGSSVVRADRIVELIVCVPVEGKCAFYRSRGKCVPTTCRQLCSSWAGGNDDSNLTQLDQRLEFWLDICPATISEVWTLWAFGNWSWDIAEVDHAIVGLSAWVGGLWPTGATSLLKVVWGFAVSLFLITGYSTWPTCLI